MMLRQLDVHMQNNAVGPHIQKLSWNGSFQVNVRGKNYTHFIWKHTCKSSWPWVMQWFLRYNTKNTAIYE